MNTEFTSAQRSKAKYQIKQIRAKTIENGCTEAEALAAHEKVVAMMAKYGFTEADFVPTAKADMQPVKAEKPAKKAKKAKAEKATGGKRGPAPEFGDDQIISVLVANPKRPGSAAHARFAKYESGMTVRQAIETGLRRDDFRWDVKHNHISIK